MERWLAQIRIPHFLFRTILLVTIVSLVLLCSPEIEAQLSSWIPVQSRIERLQERTAEELRRYYEGEGNWLRCYRLLQRLERLQQTNK